MAHTDAQVGRLVDELVSMGLWDNTLFVYVAGDNGASGEGGVHGAWSAPAFQNGAPEDPQWLLEHIDDFGSSRCENHYNAGWAWALDAPFQWTKQVASHFGGTRNGLALSWPARITAGGGLRSQFHHVIDIAATVFDAAGITAPTEVNGIEQKPLEGVSMLYSFDDADAPSTHITQYFEILGNRGIYHDGWIASCFHGRLPWTRSEAVLDERRDPGRRRRHRRPGWPVPAAVPVHRNRAANRHRSALRAQRRTRSPAGRWTVRSGNEAAMKQQ